MKRSVQELYRMSLNLGLTNVFWELYWVYIFREEYHRCDVFLSYHIRGTWYQQDLILVVVNLDPLIKLTKLLTMLLAYNVIHEKTNVITELDPHLSNQRYVSSNNFMFFRSLVPDPGLLCNGKDIRLGSPRYEFKSYIHYLLTASHNLYKP